MKAIDKKVPTCAYEIGGFTITKEGVLTRESVDDALAQIALKAAVDAGFPYDKGAV